MSRPGRKLSLLALLVAAYTLLVPMPAYAYIDPATTSYIIQIISGLVISLSVGIGVFFRRVQMSLVTGRARLAALWVRLTARKARRASADAASLATTVGTASSRLASGASSPDAAPVNPTANPSANPTPAPTAATPAQPHRQRKTLRRQNLEAMQAAAAEQARLARQTPRPLRQRLAAAFADDRRFSQRLLPAALISAAAAFTLFFFGPLDLYLGNQTYFPYNFLDIIGWVGLMFGVAWVGALVVLMLFRGRVFDYLLSIGFGVLLIVYLQGNLLNIELGELSGGDIDWVALRGQMAINLVICLGILAVPLLLRRFGQRIWRGAVLFVPALLISVQALALLTSVVSGDALEPAADKNLPFLSKEGLYEVAEEDNVFIFIVDSLDQRYLDELQATDPEFLSGQLDGFIEFDNNTSIYADTYPSVINMLTGARYEHEVPGPQFISRAWAESSFLPAMKAAGYTVKVFSDYHYVYIDASEMASSVDNIGEGVSTVNKGVALPHLAKLSCYRYLPLVLKPPFRMASTDFANDAYRVGQYIVYEDPEFYSGLKSERLSISETGGNLAVYHFNGVHEPYDLSEDVVRQKTATDRQTVTKAEFNILFEFMDQLRELGLYDSATIIITADHGVPSDGRDASWTHDLGEAVNPALLVKPAGSSGTALAVSHAPVSHDNLRAFVAAESGLDATDFGTSYLDVPANSTTARDYFFEIRHPVEGEMYIEQFSITGDAGDFSNWQLVRKLPLDYWY
ncbi:MAG: sulfatase-like hydrolase/transferase [Coriobacteriales bacterium]|jgi:hypothetical protein|nr:sulfatase-like hydrolase/transferase [Coriobacteriales bacterium]